MLKILELVRAYSVLIRDDRSLEADAVHRLDDRRILSHWRVRNASPSSKPWQPMRGLKELLKSPSYFQELGILGSRAMQLCGQAIT